MRDRAMCMCCSTVLRREGFVTLDLSQVSPREPGPLREAKRARLTAVVGKGRTTRTVFLSADARTALAVYLEQSDRGTRPIKRRQSSCRPRVPPAALVAVDSILERIGRWHDAEHSDPARSVSPLRPHDPRH
jgi:site-specific recombinase XerD